MFSRLCKNEWRIRLVIETSTRHCYKLSKTSTVDVCFSEHLEADDAKKTADSSLLSVADIETGMNAVHANLLAKSTCGTDKWLDNHYAYDSTDHETTTLGDSIVAYLDNHDEVYYYCKPFATGYMLHYIIDPTGWGIQLDMKFAKQPADCSSSLFLGSDWNPACDLGSC